jgi:hypothetical protein
MTTYICAFCAKEFESIELDEYVQCRKDDNWPLSAEDVARFVCSPLCVKLSDERDLNEEAEEVAH